MFENHNKAKGGDDMQTLSDMSTIELRALVRERGLAKGAAVASARKDDLIALIEGRAVNMDAPKLEANAETGGDLADVIARAIAGKVKAGVDEDAVKGIVAESMDCIREELSEHVDKQIRQIGRLTPAQVASLIDTALAKIVKPLVLDIRKQDGEVKRLDGVQHQRFPTLLSFAQARNRDGHVTPIYLHGPAGTGKTTAAHRLADALGLEFYFNGAIDSEYKLSGFVDAQGVFRSRPFFDAYTKGGVYLFDELDSSLPSAVLAFNAALANGHADFPTGRQTRHKDCIILAAGNTTLRGDGHHGGFQRFEMDAAFRDRFIFLEWPLDESLEAACVPEEYKDWLAIVRIVRANVAKHGLKKAEVTPRATIAGIALLAAGVEEEDVIDSTLRKGLPADQWVKASEGLTARKRAQNAQDDAAEGNTVNVTSDACPMCGKRLWVKANRRTGHKFLGCAGYPACRYTRAI